MAIRPDHRIVSIRLYLCYHELNLYIFVGPKSLSMVLFLFLVTVVMAVTITVTTTVIIPSGSPISLDGVLSLLS